VACIYDEMRERWVILVDPGDNTLLAYWSVTPTTGSWTQAASLTPVYAAPYRGQRLFALPGGVYLAHCYSIGNGPGGLFLTGDGAASWQPLIAQGGAQPHLVDGRVFLTGGRASGVFWG